MEMLGTIFASKRKYLVMGLVVTLALLVSIVVLVESKAPEATVSDPVIAAAGDIACDPTSTSFKGGNGTPNDCRQKYTSDLLVNAHLSAVLVLGDNQYECGSYAA